MPFPTTDWPAALDGVQIRTDFVDLVDDDDFNYPDAQVRRVQTWLGITGELLGDGIAGEGPGGMVSPVADGGAAIGFQFAVRAPYALGDLLSVGDAYDTAYTEKMRLDNAGGLWVLGGLQLGVTVAVTDILDEDLMTSDSAVALATQQSIKAYVDNSGWVEQDVYYVGKHGSALNTGLSIDEAFLLINDAIAAAAVSGNPSTVLVYPGVYAEQVLMASPDISLVGIGSPGDVVVSQIANPSLSLGASDISIRNITFENTSAGVANACDITVSPLVGVRIANCRFVCTNAVAIACMDLSAGTIEAWIDSCEFLQTTTTQKAFSGAGAGSDIRFTNPIFRGQVEFAAVDFDMVGGDVISANMTSAVYIGAPGGATRNEFRDCRMQCTGGTGTAIYYTSATAPITVLGGHLQGAAASYDIDGGAVNSVIKVSGVKMDVGMSANVDLVGQDRRVGASGDIDIYKSLLIAMTSVPSGSEGVVRLIRSQTVTTLMAQTTGSTVRVIGDGYTVTRVGSPPFCTNTNSFLEVLNTKIVGGVLIAHNGATGRFIDCDLTDGYVRISAGSATTKLILIRGTYQGGVGLAALSIQDGDPTIIIKDAWLRGSAGNPAIIYTVINDNLKMERCTLVHGNGVGSNPITDSGAATAYSSYLCVSHDVFDLNSGAWPCALTNNAAVSGNIITGNTLSVDFGTQM